MYLLGTSNLVSGLKYYFIGLKEDNDLLNNTKFQESHSPKDSDFVLITGPRDFDHILKDYTAELKECLKNKLPMICANPDKIVVRQNGKKIFCAGAIAEDYKKLGGTVKQFGKPHKNVFLEVLKFLKMFSPKINFNNVSIIGDGLDTDILGGNSVQINTVLITSGILSHTLNIQYGQRPDLKKLNKVISSSGHFPNAAVNVFKISS